MEVSNERSGWSMQRYWFWIGLVRRSAIESRTGGTCYFRYPEIGVSFSTDTAVTMSTALELLAVALKEYSDLNEELGKPNAKVEAAKADSQKAIADNSTGDVEAAHKMFLIEVNEARAKAKASEREWAISVLE